MRMIRYSTARLVYYKKQTIFYCLFSSIAAFLLMLACNLYHVQTTIYSQVQERLNFLDITAVKANLPSIVTIRQFYLKVIVILLTIFSVMFIFFFQRSLRQDSQELINWRLAGLSKGKIFFYCLAIDVASIDLLYGLITMDRALPTFLPRNDSTN